MLVDLGSRINVIGANAEKEFALKAELHGFPSTDSKRKHRLYINGVGSGAAPCEEEVETPIAVHVEGQSGTLDVFKANIATGCGENIPAILGSISMVEKDAVILLRKGKEQIIFPGAGGYKIQWSPGSKVLPMTPAPSGHLVVQCDHYDKITKTHMDEGLTFCTDHTLSVETRSS